MAHISMCTLPFGENSHVEWCILYVQYYDMIYVYEGGPIEVPMKRSTADFYNIFIFSSLMLLYWKSLRKPKSKKED